MKNLLTLAILAGLSSGAYAKGILCSLDSRPVDGPYTEVRLEDGERDYDITKKVITSGFGGPVTTTETTLAKGLKCNIDGLVAYCFKSGRDSGEATNSIATFKIVEVTELSSLTQAKAEKGKPVVRIEVASPLTEKRLQFDYAVSQRFGSCREL